ncbi:hypothetical protein B0H10DRAFT_1960814 [Mycena sp. CBHHK59/15]|nr:hypothetical protein B0H10DRAFT_1960814 [Mycena sp. CBHHK59/15]
MPRHMILTSDFQDRSHGPGAIKATLVASQIPDANDIDVYPPTLKEDVPAAQGPSMPWTNIMFNCSDTFKAAVLERGVFHATHNEVPISFYCLEVRLPPPRIYLTYTGLVDFVTLIEIFDTLYPALLADTDIVDVVKVKHENIPGNHTPAIILAVALHFAHITTCTIRKRVGRYNYSHPITAHRISIPPISNNEDVNTRIQSHLMLPTFSFTVPLRASQSLGWLMSCSECHGIDHYNEECPIMHSPAYRHAHGIPEPNANSSHVPNSLTLDITTSNVSSSGGWTTVRGRGHAFRGGRGEGGGRPFCGAGVAIEAGISLMAIKSGNLSNTT